MVTIDDVRAVASTLPRSTEVLVHDRVKFRVGRIVYLAFSRDETQLGFAFPKEEREALVASEPGKFLMPSRGDMRYHWVEVRLDAIDQTGDARAGARRVADGRAEERGRGPRRGRRSLTGLGRPGGPGTPPCPARCPCFAWNAAEA